MNYNRFKQVAPDFEQKMFTSWMRNRRFNSIEEGFTIWWSLDWTARDLKKTEEEYERYIQSIPDDTDECYRVGVVVCPSCGCRMGLQEVKE